MLRVVRPYAHEKKRGQGDEHPYQQGEGHGMRDRHPNTMSVSLPNPRSMPAANSMSGMTNTNAAILQASHSRMAWSHGLAQFVYDLPAISAYRLKRVVCQRFSFHACSYASGKRKSPSRDAGGAEPFRHEERRMGHASKGVLVLRSTHATDRKLSPVREPS